MGACRVLKRCSSQLSYIHGTSTEPFLHDTVGHRLQISTEATPTREAFVFRHQNVRKTYEQLYQDVSLPFLPSVSLLQNSLHDFRANVLLWGCCIWD